MSRKFIVNCNDTYSLLGSKMFDRYVNNGIPRTAGVPHVYGACTIFLDHVITWIPKNASTLVRTLGPHGVSTEIEYTDNIIFLRDPYLRWKSGIAEYASRNRKLAENFLEGMLRDGKIKFDIHTLPQTCFFNPKANNIRYYNIDCGELEKFASDFGVWQSNHIPKENASVDVIYKREWFEKLDSIVTPDIQEAVKKYYADDYRIIYENRHTGAN